MAAAATADGLTGTFNDEAVIKFLRGVLWAALIFFAGGVIDYTFFHNHPLGQEIIKIFEDYILPVFDFVAEVLGLEHLTVNKDLVDESGVPDIPDVPGL